MKRGDVFFARLNPTEGSEQSGIRPVIIVSRDAINNASTVLLVIPCTTFQLQRHIYPSQVVIEASEGGLVNKSVALGEQVRAISKNRLLSYQGTVSPTTLKQIDTALKIALDLD